MNTNDLRAWLVWAGAAALAVLLVRNPLYLILVAIATWFVFVAAGQGAGAMAQSWRVLLKIGALVWLLTIPFNALMLHQGQHVIFRLPRTWPLVGGAITLEGVLFGAVSGMQIWALLLVFTAFNAAVDASQLLRLTPAFLYQAGVVTSVAVTFVPQMLVSAQDIREAQQIRGHRFRGWRDLLPLFVPLLTMALERAILLAESMESRGFGGRLTAMTPSEGNRLRLQVLASLSGMLCGLFAYSYWHRAPLPGLLLIAASGIGLATALRSLGSRVQRSTYLRDHWRDSDTLIVLGSILCSAVLILARTADAMALSYYPFAPFPLLPRFDGVVGMAIAGLTVPGIVTLMLAAPSTLPAVPGMPGAK